MIGLALLPFMIPLLWLIAPHLFGHQPALSIATPVSLAVSASALCLAVVYTIDWTGATRLKGVLMLVGLALFAGVSLFFLKKDMVDRLQRRFDPPWHEFQPGDKSYRVELPVTNPVLTPDLQPVPQWKLTCYTARSQLGRTGGITEYVVGAGKDKQTGLADDNWFTMVRQQLVQQSGGKSDGTESIVADSAGHPGREWVILLAGQTARIVRVYRAEGCIYYLSAEGISAKKGNQLIEHQFFSSFQATPQQQAAGP